MPMDYTLYFNKFHPTKCNNMFGICSMLCIVLTIVGSMASCSNENQ